LILTMALTMGFFLAFFFTESLPIRLGRANLQVTERALRPPDCKLGTLPF